MEELFFPHADRGMRGTYYPFRYSIQLISLYPEWVDHMHAWGAFIITSVGRNLTLTVITTCIKSGENRIDWKSYYNNGVR